MLGTAEEIQSLIQTVEHEGSIKGDTTKDLEVLRSFLEYYIVHDRLSPGQMDWYVRLAEKYSQDSLEEEVEWSNQYEQYRLDIERMAHYYKANPPYFSNLVDDVLGGKKISKHAYNKLCKNKYSQKVLTQYKEPPKYKLNEMVMFRTSNKVHKVNQESDMANRLARKISTFANNGRDVKFAGFVIDNESQPIVRAARGSRRYKVLVVGHTTPIIAHESDIKKARVPHSDI